MSDNSPKAHFSPFTILTQGTLSSKSPMNSDSETRFNFKYKLLQSPSPRSLDLIKPKFLSQTQTTQMKSDEFCFSAPVPPPKKQSGWLKDFNIGSSLASYSCQLKKDRIAFMVDVPANKRQQDEPKAVEKTVISSHQEETRGEPLSSLQVPDDFFGDLKLLKSKADQEIPDALKTRMGAILMSVGNNEEMIKITEENCDMNNIGDIKEVEKEKKKSVADHYFDVCTKISAKSDLSIVAAVVEFAEVDEDMPENRPAEINSVKEAASVAEENFGCEKDHSSSVNSIIKSNIVDTTSTDSAEPSLEANDKFETEKLSIELAGTAENLDVPFESVKDHPAKSEIPLLKLGDYAAEEIEKIVVPYEEKIDEISQNDSPVALTQIPVVSVHDVIVSITSEKQAALKTIHEEVEPTSVTNCEQSGQSFAQQIVTDVSSTDVSAEKKSFPLCEKFATNQLEAPLTQTKKSSLPQMVVCPTFSASQLVTSDLAQDKMSRTNSELIDLFSPSCFKIPAPPNQRSQSRMELVVFEKKATQKPLEQPKWNDGFDAEGRQLQMSFFADCLGFPATQMSQISSQAHQHPVHEDMGCGTSQTCKVSESNSQVFRFSAIGAAAVIRSEIAAQMEHIKSTPDLSSQNSDQQYQAKELEVSPAATNTIALIRTLGAMPKRKENELIIEPVRLYPSILKDQKYREEIKNVNEEDEGEIAQIRQIRSISECSQSQPQSVIDKSYFPAYFVGQYRTAQLSRTCENHMRIGLPRRPPRKHRLHPYLQQREKKE